LERDLNLGVEPLLHPCLNSAREVTQLEQSREPSKCESRMQQQRQYDGYG